LRPVAALLLALLASGLAPLHAQSAPADSDRVHLFETEDLYWAAAFVGGTVAMFPLDRALAREIQEPWSQENQLLRLGANIDYVGRPGAFLIGGAVYGLGRLIDSERMADLGLHGSEALLLTEILTRVIKSPAGRARPLVDPDKPHDFKLGRGFGDRNYQSFPSGHTSVAFAAAAAVTMETATWWPGWKPYIGTAMYGGAALVGLSRMYRNKHWASDVAFGAALGTFTAWKVVQYNHDHPDTGLNRWLLGMSIIPANGGRAAMLWVLPDLRL
jgi:membrane-associated phospholipid phosphatase